MSQASSEHEAQRPAGLASPDTPPGSPAAAGPVAARRPPGRLRGDIPLWQTLVFSALCMGLVFALWWYLTSGSTVEQRIIPPQKLPSVSETFRSFPSLWFERALTRNTFASLRRVSLGFALAALAGVPLGVLCGCFPRVAAFCAPLTVFGRNIPMAALIPLSLMMFGIGELQKVMFIFIAAVAFIVSDTAQAIRNVAGRYIDTAYTLGAKRWQVILKVLVPLAMPDVFNSLRLLFGLAFGYIMLAEVIQVGGESGLGGIINRSRHRGPQEHIYLVLMLIPLVALTIDRILFWIQRQLFPYCYGGAGILADLVRMNLHGLALIKGLFVRRVEINMAVPGLAVGAQGAPAVSSHHRAGGAHAAAAERPAAEDPPPADGGAGGEAQQP